MKFQKSVAVAAVALFTLAACGTGAVPTAVSNPAASPAGGPTAGASNAPTASIPAAPPTSTTTPVGAVDLCALLSAGDLQTVLGGGGWLEGALTRSGDHCYWDNALTHSPYGVGTGTVTVSLATIKSATPGVDMTVSGHAGYSVRDEHLQTTWVDLGGLLLVVELPISSNAADDQTAAQALAEIAVGNM